MPKSYPSRSTKRGWLLLCAALVLCGVAAFILLRQPEVEEIASAPRLPPVEPGSIERNVLYCNGQRLDIYQPRRLKYERTPLVVYMHGGGLYAGSKDQETITGNPYMNPLLDEGIAFASINYRLMPEAFPPTQVQDARCAVRFLRAQADRYYLDTGRIGAAGFSAGAYLAAMIATVPDKDSTYDVGDYTEYSSRVRLAVGTAGPYDLSYEAISNPIVGRYGAQIAPLFSLIGQPGVYADRSDPPFLLLQGDKDTVVSPGQASAFATRLDQAGVANEVIQVRNAGHTLQAVDADKTSPDEAALADRVGRFVREHLLDDK